MNRLLLILLLAAFALLGAVYAIVTPLFEISDELWHYPMVKRLADGDGLVVQDPANPGPWRQEGSQPPLYYGLMALATFWIDTGDIAQVRWINPHADNGVITPDGNNNMVVHTYREVWPWRGTVLAVRLIRLLSVLLGAGTVYFTHRLGLELAPGRHGLALATAGFAAFTPMFLFVSASVNNDNLAIFLSAGALWLAARWLRGPGPPSTRQHILMGLLLGGAALSKVSTLGLIPLAGVALLCAQLRQAGLWDRRRAASRHEERQGAKDGGRRFSLPPLASVLFPFVIAFAVCGWWYWRNYQLYGDWLGWNAFLETVGRRPHPASLAQLWGERVGFVQAYWGLFGGVSVPMPDWTYMVLNVVMALAVVGLAWSGLQAAARRRVTLTDMALWTLLVAWILLLVIGLIRWTSLTWASQGRLIFPAISAVSALAVFGLSRLWRGLPWLAVGFMAALSTAVPFTVVAPHYGPPSELTPLQIAAIPNRVDADIGGEMKLLGYGLETKSVLPGEAVRLTLYWQSQTAMDRNWSIFVHVVDDENIIVAQRDRYPGMGALPTTLIRPGQTFADRYVIPIPEAGYAPAAARIEVGLYDLADGTRLPVIADTSHGTTSSDALTLGPLEIRARAGEVPNALRQNFNNQIELTGYDMERRTLRPGETMRLTLYWQALARIRLNYSVFAHIRGDGETLWAGQDAWPQQGASPTATWRPGHIITDTYDLTLQPDTPPGMYDVEVGLYDATTLERLQLIAEDGRRTDADFLYLSRIRVVGP